MPGIKLCILGGGSHYTHHMLYTFASHVATGALAGSTISLYDINLVIEAAMAFPSNVDLDVIVEVVDELFEKHKDWLPQFDL